MSKQLLEPPIALADTWEPFDLEPERYELQAEAVYHFALTRRDLLRLAGAGLVTILLLDLTTDVSAQESGGGRRGGGGGAQSREVGAWIHIGADGVVTVYTGKVEVGQNIRTSLAQAVAEELRVPVTSVHMVMGDTALCPYDAGTFGSRTTPGMSPQLRRAAAAAREALIDLAADRWKAGREILTALDGVIKRSDTGATIAYGPLTGGQKLVKVIEAGITLTPPAEWKVAGKPIHKTGGRDIVTGGHKYTSDIQRPGMLYGKILRPPALNSKLVSLTSSEAPGVTLVHDGEFVGVVAKSTPLATQALEKLHAEWSTPPQTSSAELYSYLKANASEGGGGNRQGGGEQGSIDAGMSAAAQTLSATYPIAYIAHVPLEPRAAVAEWEGDRLTVWTGTQRPFGVRGELAQALGIPEEKVRVIVPDTGSGYGGKHTGEAAIEAARLAKAAQKPVKLVWTRGEEFQWAYFRPAGVIEIKSGVAADGALTAWEFHNYNSGASAIQTPYAVPNRRIAFHGTKSPLRQGSYRGLASTANNFARESHMDELAHMLKMDPLAFRRKNLRDDRLRAVLDAAAERFEWGREKPATDHGFGIACGTEKGGFVATCAEIAVEPSTGKVKVLRLVAAFECGAVVNPDGLKNQIEGAMMMGIGGALFENIQFENGRVLNGSMTKYRVPRFNDAPASIEVVLVDRKDLPSEGAGESPIIATAPAIGSAIFQATGKRLRSLPMAPDGVKG